MATETRKSQTPPYIAFPTFLSFIKGLGETGVPSRIDKSLLRNMSGSNQSSLLSTLKWFGLIDEAGAHGERLDALVKATMQDKAGEILKGNLPIAYQFMTDGSIDIGRATGAQLEEKFRAYGLSGETVSKAMSFFLAACKESGIPVSAHIKLPKTTRPSGASKPKKGKAQAIDGAAGGDGVANSATMMTSTPKTAAEALMEKFPAFDPNWPENIQAQWFAAFGKMQDMVNKG